MTKFEKSNQDANCFHQKGIEYQKRQDLAKAETSFRQAIGWQPGNHLYHHALGENLTKQDRLPEAIESYRRAIELNPEFFWSYHCMAMSLLWQGQYQNSLDTITRAIAINSKIAGSHDILGRSLHKLEQIDQAIDAFHIAISLDPNLAIARHNLGDALLQQGKFRAAIQSHKKAIELDPNSFWSYFGIAQAFVGLDNYDQACKFYTKALEIDPNSATVYSALAQLEQRRGDYDLAAEYYQKAIMLNPTWELPYTMLQYLSVDDARLDKLINFYRQITTKQSDARLAWGNLGDALTSKGKLDEAIECYQNFCYQNTVAAQPKLAQLSWKSRKETAPDFIIIGAGKCGTSSLYRYICEHPLVLASHKKELNFFHGNFNKGVDWYLSHFPSITDTTEYITGEASPVYFHAPHVDQRIHELFPQTKLIVLLRNPVDRAVSWHYHQVKWGIDQRSPEVSINEAIAQIANLPEERLAHHGGHILESLYFYKLKRWMSLFPPEQFLVLQSEEFFSQPARIMTEVFDFLDLPNHVSSHYQKFNGNLYVPIEDSLRESLTAYFQPYNQKLEQYLGRSFNW